MQVLLAVGAFLAYLPVLRGLYSQIRKKYKEQSATPTQVSMRLMLSHQCRYATWIWVGLLMWVEDPITALMLVVTRTIGFCLVDITHLQRSNLRPTFKEGCSWVFPHLLVVLTVAALILSLRYYQLFALLSALKIALKFGLVLVFVFLVNETIKEIKAVRSSKDARRLPDFQLGNLVNYSVSSLYAYFGVQSSWAVLMTTLFSIATVAQAALYFEIYQARKHYRQQRAKVAP